MVWISDGWENSCSYGPDPLKSGQFKMAAMESIFLSYFQNQIRRAEIIWQAIAQIFI